MHSVVEFGWAKLSNFVLNTYYYNIEVIAWSFGVSILMALLVMLIECAYVGARKGGLYRVIFTRTKSTLLDIVYFILYSTGLITFLAILTTLGIPFLISSIIKSTFGFEFGLDLNIYVHLGIFLILSDFMAYWQHRLMHKIPFLWKIHEFHHSAEEFNTITVFREHPVDKALNSLFMVFPAVLLGVPVGEFPIFITLYGIIGYIKHAEIPWHGWFGKYVIQSPVDHYIHHSKLTEHHDANFGNVFAVWDHIFGSYYHGTNRTGELGVSDTEFNTASVVHDTVRPLKSSALVIWRSLFRNN